MTERVVVKLVAADEPDYDPRPGSPLCCDPGSPPPARRLERRARARCSPRPTARALRRALDAGALDSAASLTYYLLLSLVPCVTLVVGDRRRGGQRPRDRRTRSSTSSRTAARPRRRRRFAAALEKALESEPRSGTAVGIGVIGDALRRVAVRGGLRPGRRRDRRRQPAQLAAQPPAPGAGDVRRRRSCWRFALFLLVISKRIADALADATGIGLLSAGTLAGRQVGGDRPLPGGDRRRPLLARPHPRAPLAPAADRRQPDRGGALAERPRSGSRSTCGRSRPTTRRTGRRWAGSSPSSSGPG